MPEQMEVEIALRDSISTGLRQIGREIDNITKRMKEGGEGGTDAFNKFGKSAQDAKEAADKAKGAASGLSGFLVGMSRTLIGVTGVAAGFYAVSSALENISQKRVALQNLGTDLGFTTEKISLMQRALASIGLEANDQNKLISTFGVALRDVFKLQERSSIMTELRSMSEHNFAGKLKDMVNAGADLDVTMKSVAGEWQRLIDAGKPQAAKEFADIFQIPESVMKNIMEATKGLKAGYQIDYEISKEYLQNQLALERQMNDIVTFLEEKVKQAYNAAIRMLKVFDWNSLMPYILPPGPEKKGDIGPKEPKQMGMFGLQDSGVLPVGSGIASYVERGMREEDKKTNRLLGEIADTLKIFESTTRTSGGGYTSRAGLGSGLDLGGAARVGGGGGGSGGAPIVSSPIGAAPMGQPRALQGFSGLSRFASPAGAQTGFGLSQSQHAPIQTQQPLPAGSSGSSGGTAGATSQTAANVRYNNPGAMYPGRAAQMFGTTGTGIIGGGHKIANFPTATHGAAANMQNLAMNYKGMKVGDALRKWSGGSRGAPVGYDKDQIITDELLQDKRFMTGFMKAITGGEARGKYPMTDDHWDNAYTMYRQGSPGDVAGGGGRGFTGGVSGGGGGGVPASVSTVGANVREIQSGIRRGALSAQTRGYLDYASSQTDLGVDVTSGGQPSSGPNRTGSHRHDLGGAGDVKLFEMVDGKKRYLDMNIPADKERMETFTAHAVHAGASGVGAGMGYMGASTIHIGGGKSATWGGADWIARAHQRGTEMRDRAAVDSSNGRKGGGKVAKGSVKAEVDFSNVPAATAKSGDELGKFKLLKITPAAQGAKDHEGLMTPGDLAHTPYVP